MAHQVMAQEERRQLLGLMRGRGQSGWLMRSTKGRMHVGPATHPLTYCSVLATRPTHMLILVIDAGQQSDLKGDAPTGELEELGAVLRPEGGRMRNRPPGPPKGPQTGAAGEGEADEALERSLGSQEITRHGGRSSDARGRPHNHGPGHPQPPFYQPDFMRAGPVTLCPPFCTHPPS